MRPSPNPRVLEAVNAAEALIYSIGSLYTSIVPSLILQGVGAAIAGSGGPRFKILILNGSLDRETGGFSAADFIAAIARAGEESRGITFNHGEDVDREVWVRYVTHLIHLEGEGVPRVDKEGLGKWGVECVRLYGRKGEDGTARYDRRAVCIFHLLGIFFPVRNTSWVARHVRGTTGYLYLFVRAVSLLELLPCRRNTDSETFIARAGVGGNIGKERERGEEQKEHARRMRRNTLEG